MIQFDQTILTADELNSSSVTDSAIILMMFGFLWGIGIFILFLTFCQRQFQKDKIQKFHIQKIKSISRHHHSTNPSSPSPSASSPPSSTSIVEINRVLTKYLDEVFPVVFQTQSYFTRMINELLRHHRYIQLISSRSDAIGRKKVVTCFHLLTIQTMLMFLLGLCYELQVGSCLPLSHTHHPIPSLLFSLV
jgi:hypothetical protein